jgi:hypothetical protein
LDLQLYLKAASISGSHEKTAMLKTTLRYSPSGDLPFENPGTDEHWRESVKILLKESVEHTHHGL